MPVRRMKVIVQCPVLSEEEAIARWDLIGDILWRWFEDDIKKEWEEKTQELEYVEIEHPEDKVEEAYNNFVSAVIELDQTNSKINPSINKGTGE